MSVYLPDNVHLSSNVSGAISDLVLGVDVSFGRQQRLDRRLVTLLGCKVQRRLPVLRMGQGLGSSASSLFLSSLELSDTKVYEP